jgi:hypothetical protein
LLRDVVIVEVHEAFERHILGVLTVVACLCLGTAQAGDSGARHHAEGQYDGATATYIVTEGDDLDAIAERFGVTVVELKERNHLASDKIEVGQNLVVAAGTPG